VSARDVLAVLDEEVQRLPEVYRLPVVLCCLEGLSQEEAAGRLGWSAGSVKGRLERGRARLHARLARRGLTLPAALGAVTLTRGVVSAALADAAVRTALVGVTGGAGDVPAHVAVLAAEVLRSLTVTRLKTGAALLVAVVALGLGAGGVASQMGAGPAEEQPAQPRPEALAPIQPPRLYLTAADDGKVIRAVVGQEIVVRLEYPEPSPEAFDGGRGSGITPGQCTQYLNVDEATLRHFRQAGQFGPNTALFRFRVTTPGRDRLAIRVFDKGSWQVRDFAVTLDVPGAAGDGQPARPDKQEPPRQEPQKEKDAERTPAELLRAATTAPDGRESYPVLPALSTPMRGQAANEMLGAAAVRAAFAKLDRARERNVTWFEGVKELEDHKAAWCLACCLCHPSSDVQIHALRALKRLGDRRVVPFLVLYAEYMAVTIGGSENATIHGVIHTDVAQTLSALTGVRVEIKGQNPEGLLRGVRLWRRWLVEQEK
jgi:hypothetical protein